MLDLGDRQEVYLGAARPARDAPGGGRRSSIAASRASGATQAGAPTRSARRSPAPAIPRGHGGAPIDSQGARRERLALEGWGAEEEDEDDGEPLERAGGVRAGGAGLARLLDLQRRAARRGPAPHGADRPAAGASGQPPAPAGPAARPRRPAAHAAGESDAGRDHRAALPASARSARCGSSCSATSRARWTSTAASCSSSSSRCSTSSRRVETFTFSTRLTRVTELSARRASYRRCCAGCRSVRDWSGGTRIGESLAEFNRAVGAPGGPPHDRDRAVRRLGHGRARTSWPPSCCASSGAPARVIWLNPLLGNPSYEPLTRGMAAALPLVDHFAAAHNLAALRELADRLHL